MTSKIEIIGQQFKICSFWRFWGVNFEHFWGRKVVFLTFSKLFWRCLASVMALFVTLKVLLLGVFLAPKVDKWPRKSKFLVSKPFLERNQMERRLSIGPPSVLLSQSLRGIKCYGRWMKAWTERLLPGPKVRIGLPKFFAHDYSYRNIISKYSKHINSMDAG